MKAHTFLLLLILLGGCHSAPVVECEEGVSPREPANQTQCRIKPEWETEKVPPSSVFKDRH